MSQRHRRKSQKSTMRTNTDMRKHRHDTDEKNDDSDDDRRGNKCKKGS